VFHWLSMKVALMLASHRLGSMFPFSHGVNVQYMYLFNGVLARIPSETRLIPRTRGERRLEVQQGICRRWPQWLEWRRPTSKNNRKFIRHPCYLLTTLLTPPAVTCSLRISIDPISRFPPGSLVFLKLPGLDVRCDHRGSPPSRSSLLQSLPKYSK
jgi:hypothetical protein